MQIKKIIVKKLFGYINKSIEFNDEINILVGINGSGKTSILNLINWLLLPSFPNLCVTEYEEVQLFFNYKKDDYLLTSNQDKVEVTINLENLSKNIKYNKIQATFKIHPSEITKNERRKEEYKPQYANLGPDPHEVNTWNLLFSEMPAPIIIGLDRNLFTNESDELKHLLESNRKTSDDYELSKMPLKKVIELTRKHYGVFRTRILDLNIRLNNKIMLSSFDEIYNDENISELFNANKISLRQVELLEGKVVKYFEENKIFNRQGRIANQNKTDDAIKKVETYFINLKKIITTAEKEMKESKTKISFSYLANINQFIKIGNLIKEFEEFENNYKVFEKPIKEYIDAVNHFFKDSSKQVYFERESADLRFKILDKNQNIVAERRDIRTLSSGELQILILLTYLKFYSIEGKLFIIDEPEISLHPKWQDEFLDQIMKITPKGTQIMIATHSPAIVGKHENFCKVLFPYNN